MKKSRFTDSPVLAVLKQAETGHGPVSTLLKKPRAGFSALSHRVEWDGCAFSREGLTSCVARTIRRWQEDCEQGWAQAAPRCFGWH